MALLHVENLYKGFSGETLFKNITFSIDQKDKIGVIGVNGAGKTTLIKMMLEMEENDVDPSTDRRGTISKKGNLKVGYLSQNINLNYENTVFEELMTVFSSVLEDYKKIHELSLRLNIEENFDKIMEELSVVSTRYEQAEGYSIEYKVKQILNGLSLPEDLWNVKIGDLSGGQKSRTALGKILLEEPELLILDEPTNHLDLVAIEWLEKFLKDYNKAVMVVSHDRYFLEGIVNTIYEITENGAEKFKGDYEAYCAKKKEVKEEKVSEGVNDYEEQKRIKNRISSLERKYSEVEKDIEKLENKKEDVQKDYDLAGKINDLEKLLELQNRLEALDNEILSKMEEWEDIENELKTLKNTL